MSRLDVPSVPEAEEMLRWAETSNPGPWVAHSKTVARAASAIASCCGMDIDTCYVLGLLHDIGRFKGRTALRHVIDGYQLMKENGWDKAAAACLTHSFPIKDLALFNGVNDCSEIETARIVCLLEKSDYDDELRLIQLCDGLSLPGRVTVLEKRLMEVAVRHGVTPGMEKKWHQFMRLKQAFDSKCGTNIYHLFRAEIEEDLFI